jgi:ectoine hydroxylase
MDIYPTRKVLEPALIFRRDPVVYGGPDQGPLEARDLQVFAENGYLTVDRLLTLEEVDRLRTESSRLLADEALRRDERTVMGPQSGEVRSIFEIHKISEEFAQLVRDPRVIGRARQLLGSDVYVHQSRFDHRPGFAGEDFFWHSDFETFHAEDGMPRMRALSISVALEDTSASYGGLLVMPGSHRTFVSIVGNGAAAPGRASVRPRQIGTPDTDSLTMLANRYGIELLTGPAGSATIFDSNCMHGSNGNITPFPELSVRIVFNSVENRCTRPYGAAKPRPPFISSRDCTPVG